MASLRIVVCFLLMTTSFPLHYHVTSFAIHKRHSRSTDLGDALRMLERQRQQRFGINEDRLLASAPELLEQRNLGMADLQPWFNAQESSSPDESLDAAWLAKTLGLADYDGVEEEGRLPEEEIEEPAYFRRLPAFLPSSPPVEVQQPTDQELDAIFGEKPESANKKKRADTSSSSSSSSASSSPSKKDKEVMTHLRSDVKEGTAPVAALRTRSSAAAPAPSDVIEVKTTSSESSDDVRLTQEEFKALLKAVEKLQRQAMEKADQVMEEPGEVLEEVKEKVQEVQEEAEEAAEAVEDAVAEEAKEEEQEEEEEEGEDMFRPQPVSKEELDNLFEDQSEEVIPTDNGQIVKTEKTLRDPEGRPIGREETVEEVEENPGGSGKDTLSSIEDFWYLKNYLDQEGERKKRNSKRNDISPSLGPGLSLPEVISPPDSADLIAAYVQRIAELQTELDQTKLEAYLEDVENDILTDALNQATLAQVRGRINPEELTSLQDAIKVEEALQEVKASRFRSDDLMDEEESDDDDVISAADDDMQKRGEPWKKRTDVTQAEVPVFLTGDSDDVIQDDDDVGDDDSEEETTSVALGKWFDENQSKVNLNNLLEASAEDLGYLAQRGEDSLTGRSPSTKVASLFSSTADQCPAVQMFSTNCDFAGDSIDFEARALCNVHEMCYSCGQSLGVGQSQCDFIYRAASTVLCQRDEDCVLEAEIFLNTMKLKHRFVPYSQNVCRTKCTAQFLSIV